MKLDLDTLLTPRLSWQFIVAWALAATGAIVIGVVPALWINSRRASASAAESTTSAEVKPALDDDSRTQHMSVEPIEPSPPPPATGATGTRAEPTVPSVPAASASATTRNPTTSTAATVAKPSKASRPKADRVKQPTSRTPKHDAAPCDVYLHPHGCPH